MGPHGRSSSSRSGWLREGCSSSSRSSSRFRRRLLERFRALHAALRPKDAFDALLSVATIALAPALAEEFLVRGTLLPALARITPRRVAIVLSAVAFALIHSDPRLWLFTFALGLVLGWLRLRSGTLLLPMAVHALFNTITFLVAPLVDDGTNATNPAAGLMLLLGGLVFGLPLGRALDRSMGPTSSDDLVSHLLTHGVRPFPSATPGSTST